MQVIGSALVVRGACRCATQFLAIFEIETHCPEITCAVMAFNIGFMSKHKNEISVLTYNLYYFDDNFYRNS
jgi:hypothetical protein